MSQPIVKQERLIKASIQKVWDHISTEEGFKSWLGAKEYKPQVGAKTFFDVNHQGGHYHMTGEVVAFNPPYELAFTWLESEVGGEAWPAHTTVRITLSEKDGGTLLTLTHEGFENLPDDIAYEQYDSYNRGWSDLNDMERLASEIESA